MSVLIELAEQALQQATQMNNAALENDWGQVAEIQTKHGELVSKIAITEVEPQLTDELRNILIEVRKLNGETEALAASTKDGLIKEKQTIDKANKMQKALDAFK